jgi:hypothetical protein
MLYSVEDWEVVEKHQNYVPILGLSRLYARQVDLVELCVAFLVWDV